ncbi:MAG: hypothetical protein ACYDD4_01450 [Acidimicrobiales bacterium]
MARVGVVGVAAATVMTVASAGSAYADTVLPGQQGSYQVSADSAGLYLAVAGNQLSGGTASVSGAYSNNTANTPALGETAAADGQGFLLSSQITGNGATASVDTSKPAPYSQQSTEGSIGDSASNGGTGGSDAGPTAPTTPDDCAQGGGQVQNGVGGALTLGCGYATASVDAPGAGTVAGPQALGVGNIASIDVSLGGILNQIYGGGASALCAGLGGVPTLGQTLDDACSHILDAANVNPTLQVSVGNAWAQLNSASTYVQAESHSSSVDISVFEALNSGTESLLDITIPSATAGTCEGTGCVVPPGSCSKSAAGWTTWYTAGAIELSGVLVDDLSATQLSALLGPLEHTFNPSAQNGGIYIDIPPCGTLSALTDGINGSPLGALLQLQLATADVSGGAVSGSGAEVRVLPGMAPGGADVVKANLAGIDASNGATLANSTQPNGGSTTTLPNVATLPGGSSPTSVHTGEWWAGSLPLIVALLFGGSALIAWPRLRRVAWVTRMTSRSGR